MLLRKYKARARGSLTIDAAVCIPVFVIALGVLLSLINFISDEERAYFEAETRIQTVGCFGGGLELGRCVDMPDRGIYIDHVQTYPIIKAVKLPFAELFIGSSFSIMDMPYRTYIGESPDLYRCESVYIFPKNEGSENKLPKYHTSSCSAVKGSLTKGYLIERLGKDEARSRGYGLCEHCRKHDEFDRIQGY